MIELTPEQRQALDRTERCARAHLSIRSRTTATFWCAKRCSRRIVEASCQHRNTNRQRTSTRGCSARCRLFGGICPDCCRTRRHKACPPCPRRAPGFRTSETAASRPWHQPQSTPRRSLPAEAAARLARTFSCVAPRLHLQQDQERPSRTVTTQPNAHGRAQDMSRREKLSVQSRGKRPLGPRAVQQRNNLFHAPSSCGFRSVRSSNRPRQIFASSRGAQIVPRLGVVPPSPVVCVARRHQEVSVSPVPVPPCRREQRGRPFRRRSQLRRASASATQ